jgi:hypothetical protein
VALLAAAWSRPPTDSARLDQLSLRSGTVYDERVLSTLISVVRDQTRDYPVRVQALKALVRQFANCLELPMIPPVTVNADSLLARVRLRSWSHGISFPGAVPREGNVHARIVEALRTAEASPEFRAVLRATAYELSRPGIRSLCD